MKNYEITFDEAEKLNRILERRAKQLGITREELATEILGMCTRQDPCDDCDPSRMPKCNKCVGC